MKSTPFGVFQFNKIYMDFHKKIVNDPYNTLCTHCISILVINFKKLNFNRKITTKISYCLLCFNVVMAES